MSETPNLDDLELDRALNSVSKQADEVLDEGTEWVELVEQLNIPTSYRTQDPYSAWHAAVTDFDAVFLAALRAKTEDEFIIGLSDRLADNPEIADAFRFEIDDLSHGEAFIFRGESVSAVVLCAE
ncbi:hypothetical protein [Haladaptatus halobius]|uniref:hypothetical protein n=1 Tax=Haladaptatus halobius TaxID=2884875 RepID=UPI001D0B99A8|nr:hypothetical protein [Haladaptatus halobius]